MFKTRSNNHYFMHLWKRYLDGYLDVISYSLNANHFHFLVRVRYFSAETLMGRTEHELVAERLKIFFRTYLTYLIQYIHVNPEKNKLCADFRTWEWSSYKYIVTSGESLVDRNFVLDWFGSLREFKQFHSSENQEVDIRSFLSDDED